MSNAPSTLGTDRTTTVAEDSPTDLQALLERAADTLTAPFEFVGFWSAVALPLLYVPMLFGGLGSSEVSLFVALVAAHAVSLVAGHGYRND